MFMCVCLCVCVCVCVYVKEIAEVLPMALVISKGKVWKPYHARVLEVNSFKNVSGHDIHF